MKKKGINIVLIIFLIIVWGLLGYRFFYKPKADVTNYISDNIVANQQVYKKFSKDTFELNVSLLKKDPFLGKVLKGKPTFKKVSTTSRKKIKVKEKKPWPRVEYLGFLKSNNNKYPLALLRLNSKLYRVRNKQEVNDILVQRVYKDSILLNKNNEIKVIERKE